MVVIGQLPASSIPAFNIFDLLILYKESSIQLQTVVNWLRWKTLKSFQNERDTHGGNGVF